MGLSDKSMKTLSFGLLVTAALMNVGSAQDDGGAAFNLVVLLIFLICNIAIPCYLYQDLVQLDNKLPIERRYMTGGMSALWWIMCCCVSCLGNVILYVVAKQEIQNRLVLLQSGQGGMVPMNTYVAYAQPATPMAQATPVPVVAQATPYQIK